MTIFLTMTTTLDRFQNSQKQAFSLENLILVNCFLLVKQYISFLLVSQLTGKKFRTLLSGEGSLESCGNGIRGRIHFQF